MAASCRILCARGSRVPVSCRMVNMLANFSDLVLGARYRARFEAIAAGK